MINIVIKQEHVKLRGRFHGMWLYCEVKTLSWTVPLAPRRHEIR